MFAHVRFTSLLIVIGLVLATDVSAAERIWDSDLKRYLTEDEINHAEVFMTEEDAVKIMLAGSERVRKDVIRLSQEKKGEIEQRIGWKFPEESFELYIGETGDRIDGYAMVQQHHRQTQAHDLHGRGR